ncbi:MAG: tetratricopeptide repeat protein [Verrucomicrobiota bacterium]
MRPDRDTILKLCPREQWGDILKQIGDLRPEGLEDERLMFHVMEALYAADQSQRALDWCNRLVELRQDRPQRLAIALYNRGMCHQDLEKWTEAELDFRRAVELGCERAVLKLSRALGFQRRYREAIDVAQRSGMKPDVAYHEWLGHCYNQLDDFQWSLRHYEEAHRLDPKDPGILASLANAWDLTGGWKNIIDHRQQIEDLLKDQEFYSSWDGYLVLAALSEACHEAGDERRAIRYAEQELEHPEFEGSREVILYNMGIASMNLEKYRKALDYFERALDLEHPLARERITECLDELGDASA